MCYLPWKNFGVISNFCSLLSTKILNFSVLSLNSKTFSEDRFFANSCFPHWLFAWRCSWLWPKLLPLKFSVLCHTWSQWWLKLQYFVGWEMKSFMRYLDWNFWFQISLVRFSVLVEFLGDSSIFFKFRHVWQGDRSSNDDIYEAVHFSKFFLTLM